MFKSSRRGWLYFFFAICGFLYFACFILSEDYPVKESGVLGDESEADLSGVKNQTCKKRSGVFLRPKFYENKKLRAQLWPKDPECSKYETRRAQKGELPPVALASYPGSGNTWVRYLIEAMTGIFTGSIYQDHHLYFSGFGGELADWRSGQTVVQKTHDFGPIYIKNFTNGTGTRAVLIIRNPYDAILSYHNYLYGGHNGYAPIEDYDRPEWKLFLYFQIKNWLGTIMNWLEFADDVFVIHYEMMKENPKPILRQLGDFLGLSVDDRRLYCIMKYPRGKFKRTSSGKTEKKKDPFPPEFKVIIDRTIRYTDFLLKKHCLFPVPFHLYSHYNGRGPLKKVTVVDKINATADEKSLWVTAIFDWMPQVGKVLGIDHLEAVVKNAEIFKGFDVAISPEFNEKKVIVNDFKELNRTLLESLPKDFTSERARSVKLKIGKLT